MTKVEILNGKQQQTFEEWFAHLTSSEEMEAGQALSEFRGKIALEIGPYQ
ncbi:hypothetical protein [Paenibacillus sp. 23TSA30-6]|nr:hypothetical protein [Paenibacillus sp. 23TSA30-6]